MACMRLGICFKVKWEEETGPWCPRATPRDRTMGIWVFTENVFSANESVWNFPQFSKMFILSQYDESKNFPPLKKKMSTGNNEPRKSLLSQTTMALKKTYPLFLTVWCSPGYTQNDYVAMDDLECLIPLPPSFEHWGYKLKPAWPILCNAGDWTQGFVYAN